MATYAYFGTGNQHVRWWFDVVEYAHSYSEGVAVYIDVWAEKTGGSTSTSSSGSYDININGAYHGTQTFGSVTLPVNGGAKHFGRFFINFGAGCGEGFSIAIVFNMPNCSVGSGNASSQYYFSLGHSYVATLQTNATCTAAATYKNICSKCGGPTGGVYSSGNPLGHAWSTTSQAATCTANGWTKNTCTRCGVSNTTYTSALGHNYASAYTYANNNGVTNGMRYKKCTRCTATTGTQYLVSTTPGAGIASMSGAGWYNHGATPSVSATVHPGYTWKEWSWLHAGTTYARANNPYTWAIKEATAFTANATPNEYKLTIDPNGGKFPDTGLSNIRVMEPNLIFNSWNYTGIVTLQPTRVGYKFIGFTVPDGTWVYDETGYHIKNTAYWTDAGYSYPGDMTLIAQWELTANCQIKHGGKYIPAMMYKKQDGIYKVGAITCKHNGTYKPTGL